MDAIVITSSGDEFIVFGLTEKFSSYEDDTYFSCDSYVRISSRWRGDLEEEEFVDKYGLVYSNDGGIWNRGNEYIEILDRNQDA